jgi:hypothetical protein
MHVFSSFNELAAFSASQCFASDLSIFNKFERFGVPISSFLLALGYDDAKKELEVVMKNGAAYVYRGVPKEAYEEMKNTESTSFGEFYSRYIKGHFKSAYRILRGKTKEIMNPVTGEWEKPRGYTDE